MTELVEAVAGCMEAHSAMGAMGWRYHKEDDLAELVVYATPFERVTDLHWHAQGFGPDDDDGPHISIEGTYQGHYVWLRVLEAAPDDEEPGLQLDTSASP
jgi:hypothetical protein